MTRKVFSYLFVAAVSAFVHAATCQTAAKSYKHASEYKVAILDENLRVSTGSDATLARTQTDAKLGGGGQGIHLLHTKDGDFRVEGPVNKGTTFLSAMAAGMANVPAAAVVYHNKWFLDHVQPGTQVLFAVHCAKPHKKHPNDTVRCDFWFPDPDSDSHEYATLGDFTPYNDSDNSNVAKAANALCGTGKLNADTEAQLCVTKPITPPPPPPAQ